MCFTCSSLTVCKDRTIITIQKILDQLLACVFEYVFLRPLMVVNTVKGKDFRVFRIFLKNDAIVLIVNYRPVSFSLLLFIHGPDSNTHLNIILMHGNIIGLCFFKNHLFKFEFKLINHFLLICNWTLFKTLVD